MIKNNLWQKLLFIGALLVSTSSALAVLNPSDPMPLSPLLKKGQLENGLTYYIQPNSKPERRVELRLVIKAGSILEDDDQQGLAHFLEHMAFNGSEHFKRAELISYLQSIGVKFGADLNASTGFDETNYFLPIPTDKKENLEKGFQVLQDWAGGLTLNDADIDAERQIVLEEARLGKGASDRMSKQLLPAIFNGSRYADRLPIGKEALIKSFPYEALRRFYRDWYRPNLMAVIVVGDVDPAQAEAMIKKHFAKLKNPPNQRPRNYADIPARSSSSALIVTDKEATNPFVLIRYPVEPAFKVKTNGDYRQQLIENLSAAMLAQRLSELTQQADPPYIFAGAGRESLAPGYRTFATSIALGKAGTARAIQATVQEIEKARQFGFHQDELARAKKNMLRGLENTYNERDKTNSDNYANEFTRNFLMEEYIPGIAEEYRLGKILLAEISLDEVNRFAAGSLPHKAAKLVAYMGPEQAGTVLPEKQQLLDMVNSAEAAMVVADTENALPTSLMSTPPKAGKIVSESSNTKLGTTEFVLSNGLKVIVKSTDFKSDQILLSAARFGGQSLFDDQDLYNARFASTVIQQMGMGDFKPLEIQKIMAGKSFNVNSSIGNYTENLSAVSTTQDLEAMFQALYLRIVKPHHDKDLFQAFVGTAQEATKNTMVRPEAIFSDAIKTALYQNHPRVQLVTKPQDFDHLSLARIEQIYQQRFASARGFTFVMAGNIDLDKLRPLLETYLASLPTADISASYRDLGIRPVRGIVKREVYAGSEPKSTISLSFSGVSTYSPEENLRFNAMLEVMNLRIVEVLREKMSLIYTGSIGGGMERVPYQHYLISAQLPCGPENVDKVLAAMQAEIDRLKAEGPSAAELEKVKQNWLKNTKIAMRTNQKWLGALQTASLFKTDPAELLSEQQRIEKLSAAEVQQAAKTYLDTRNYVQVVLYPAKADAVKPAQQPADQPAAAQLPTPADKGTQ